MFDNYRSWKIDLVTGESTENIQYIVMDYVIRHYIPLKTLKIILDDCDFITVNVLTGAISEWDNEDMDDFDDFFSDRFNI